MDNLTNICRNILYDFLDKWTVDEVKNLTLEQYVSVGDKDTFCQWIEIKTYLLGSIKGINASKFGIYKRKNINERPKNRINDNEYSWLRYYSETSRNEAFKNIIDEILKIIEFSQNGKYEEIDHLHLTQFFRWKIAFLYSNERLIPIFNKEVLIKIAKYYGLNANYRTPNSEIQKVMIANKPAHLSIYEYSEELYNRFGKKQKKKSGTVVKEKVRHAVRKAATEKNTTTQTRRGASTYVAIQKHNLLQEVLKEKLIAKYGKKNVVLEENFVDIKVTQPDKILLYEVKSSAYASDCIREGLGQILSYAHNDEDKRPKHLVIAGQYKPNEDENEYINFIKRNLNVSFSYENIDIDGQQ